MSNTFSLLWGKILDSSLWIQGSKETRLVWIALLAMKDMHGEVHASVVGLADRAKVSVEECREALGVLLSPDVEDTSKVEEGRRIKEIPGGWVIVNHELYRNSVEAKRAIWRESKALQRSLGKKGSKRRGKGGAGPTARERAFEEAQRRGDVAECDRLAAGSGNGGVEAGARQSSAEGQSPQEESRSRSSSQAGPPIPEIKPGGTAIAPGPKAPGFLSPPEEISLGEPNPED